MIDWKGKPYDREERPGRAPELPLHGVRQKQSHLLAACETTPEACPSARSCSAAAAASSRRSSTKPATGSTACWSARSVASGNHRSGPSARPAWCAATRWRCCRSAATTSRTTGRHWLNVGGKLKNPPRIYHVNWFRRDADGKFPVAGLRREPCACLRVDPRSLCRQGVQANETAIGNLPRPQDYQHEGASKVTSTDLAGAAERGSGPVEEGSRRIFARTSRRMASRFPRNWLSSWIRWKRSWTSKAPRNAQGRSPRQGTPGAALNSLTAPKAGDSIEEAAGGLHDAFSVGPFH